MIKKRKVIHRKQKNSNTVAKDVTSSTPIQKTATTTKATGAEKVGLERKLTRAECDDKITLAKASDKTLPILALNTTNAAIACGVSESLLRKMRGEGTGPIYVRFSGKILYLPEDLNNYLAENRVQGGR